MNNNTDDRHDLFLDLDAFDPKWQIHYKTIALAATAAKVMHMYSEWLGTVDGRRYQEILRDVPDTIAKNEAERLLREKAARIVGGLA